MPTRVHLQISKEIRSEESRHQHDMMPIESTLAQSFSNFLLFLEPATRPLPYELL